PLMVFGRLRLRAHEQRARYRLEPEDDLAARVGVVVAARHRSRRGRRHQMDAFQACRLLDIGRHNGGRSRANNGRREGTHSGDGLKNGNAPPPHQKPRADRAVPAENTRTRAMTWARCARQSSPLSMPSSSDTANLNGSTRATA